VAAKRGRIDINKSEEAAKVEPTSAKEQEKA
jgi:hypothetical protein